MVKDDDLELDQLLAGGHLSGRQYDQIEKSVLKQAAPPRRRWSWAILAPAATLASAVGIWLLVVGNAGRAPENDGAGVPPSAFGGRSHDTPLVDKLTPKGDGTAVPSALEAGCGDATRHVCRLGETLMFSAGPSASGYLVAYAERLGDPRAERIWYFPSALGSAPHIEAEGVTRVLPQGVRLGPPHTRGRYAVTLWLSETPVTRADVEAGGAAARGRVTLEIAD